MPIILQDPNIVIAAMDATAQDVPKDFSVQVQSSLSLYTTFPFSISPNA